MRKHLLQTIRRIAACCGGALLLLLSWCVVASAEPSGQGSAFQRRVVSDRPSFTEASSTVGLAHTVIETGYTFGVIRRSSDTSQSDVHGYPELLLRSGVAAEWFEVRFGFSLATRSQDDSTETESGAIEPGFRLALFEQRGLLPEAAITGRLGVPTESETGASWGERLTPGVSIPYSWSVLRWFDLAGTTEIRREWISESSLSTGGAAEGSAGAHTVWSQAFVGTVKPTSQLSVFLGWRHREYEPNSRSWHRDRIDLGVLIPLGVDVQLDLRAEGGLDEALSRDFSFGSGVVVRLP